MQPHGTPVSLGKEQWPRQGRRTYLPYRGRLEKRTVGHIHTRTAPPLHKRDQVACAVDFGAWRANPYPSQQPTVMVGITLLHDPGQSATRCKFSVFELGVQTFIREPRCIVFRPTRSLLPIVVMATCDVHFFRALNLKIYGTISVIAAHDWSTPLAHYIRDIERPH